MKLEFGSYYLVFINQSASNTSVAEEFYVGRKQSNQDIRKYVISRPIRFQFGDLKMDGASAVL